ncbi:2-oxoisovalerate dehydrogenase subunit mitochondrial [Brachionus plicatilis]|uniref:2-oxoisovalerate dehydrogenase subunit alpha n=1 Tax=Brachionus plicatilis TaxID=10195 RepID=A0A3M7PUC1_BRAPC|nr:2-oxoisovalerate dehydrogenase subunit mitochondrial [Brachionus plicatilis]
MASLKLIQLWNKKSTSFYRSLFRRNLTSATSISDKASFPGYKGEFSTELQFIYPENNSQIQCYRVMNRKGNIIDPSHEPQFDHKTLLNMYTYMNLLAKFDIIMYEAQRQGRISFYMQNHGETAAQIGSAAALDSQDLIYAQYRESGVLMYRGFTIQQFCDQIYGNSNSSCKGKQMPVHYGSKEFNFVTISSPLATQIPQAVGSAYAYKRKQNGLCVITYFGEGAASEGDAHAAMNFASVFDVPLIFFCRNNGYAISTPVKEQYRGDGIAARGPAYGIVTIRVDGNDLFAVYNATRAARQIAIKESRPVLIEAMTYRLGHHSTSDDSTAYRSVDEINLWEKGDNPMNRFRNYLFRKGILNEKIEEELTEEHRKMIMESITKSERTKNMKPTEMFLDVFDRPSQSLLKQQNEFLDHLKQNKEHYPLDTYEKL